MRGKAKPRGKGKPFTKGDPRAGRPKGSLNKVTVDMRQAAQALIARPKYQENFQRAWDERNVPPAVEAMIYHYAYGKPTETHEVTGPGGGPLKFDRIELVLVKGNGKAAD
jgi:hypothetical protein